VSSILYIVYLIIIVYGWLIVLRALLSWFRLRPGTVMHSFYRWLYTITEPYLALFRRFLPISRFGSVGIDWSSLVALVVLFVVAQIIARL
jgi:YggT family protein